MLYSTTTMALFLLMATSALATTQTTKPNIVFVLVDDWGYADVGFHNPGIRTPNFDTLASTGLLLD